MGVIFGILGLNDQNYQYVHQAGQQLVFDATAEYLQRVNADAELALSVFLESTTTNYTERYLLPGGGRLQRMSGLANNAAARASGKWDVAYPLEEFGTTLGADRITLAYMSPQEYEVHVQNVVIQYQNTLRYEVLKALFNNTARTFKDLLRGVDLTIQPLANNDSVVYPPVFGSETEATENLYLESGYLASAISNTNNPLPTMRDKLESHFGAVTGGENIVVFMNQAQTAKVTALSTFVPVVDNWIQASINTNIPVRLPNVPGRILGRSDGCWVSEWRWMSANYMLAVHLEAPQPLKKRIDPPDVGLGDGTLRMISNDDEYPLQAITWSARFGIGVGNRLNGVVMELGNGGTYDIPSGY